MIDKMEILKIEFSDIAMLSTIWLFSGIFHDVVANQHDVVASNLSASGVDEYVFVRVL